MDYVRIVPASFDASVASAKWLSERLEAEPEQWVTGTVGSGFDAYARVFHPAGDREDVPWADVAARTGRTMHASAQWEDLSSPASLDTVGRAGRDLPARPRIGMLSTNKLIALCAILDGHTGTPEDCYFAVWDGWGWENPGSYTVLTASTDNGDSETEPVPAPEEWQLDLTGPRVFLGLDYLLFSGPLRGAPQIGYRASATSFEPQSPSIFWPSDHAWCVATDIDFDSTLIGGSHALIRDVIHDPRLEAWPIAPDAPFHDSINS